MTPAQTDAFDKAIKLLIEHFDGAVLLVHTIDTDDAPGKSEDNSWWTGSRPLALGMADIFAQTMRRQAVKDYYEQGNGDTTDEP